MTKKTIPVSDVKLNQEVFVSPDSEEKFIVLDSNTPFVLLENVDTHFCYLYHSSVLFIDDVK